VTFVSRSLQDIRTSATAIVGYFEEYVALTDGDLDRYAGCRGVLPHILERLVKYGKQVNLGKLAKLGEVVVDVELPGQASSLAKYPKARFDRLNEGGLGARGRAQGSDDESNLAIRVVETRPGDAKVIARRRLVALEQPFDCRELEIKTPKGLGEMIVQLRRELSYPFCFAPRPINLAGRWRQGSGDGQRSGGNREVRRRILD
jgi:hypothetical protein